MDNNHTPGAAGLPPIGSQVTWHKSVDSTNTLAMQMAVEEAAPHGLVVIAEHQTAGRGRRGRSWVEPAGSSLLLSVVLRPRVAPERAGQIMLLSGLAVAGGIRRATGLSPRLKWPNDVLLGDRKVSGILIETAVEAHQMEVAIVGIGVNCNQGKDEFPAKVRDQATSLALQLGRQVDRTEVLANLLSELALYYDQFIRGDSEGIADEWREHSATLGERVMVTGFDDVLEGVAQDITEDGLLLIRDDDGVTHHVAAGDVHLRRATTT